MASHGELEIFRDCSAPLRDGSEARVFVVSAVYLYEIKGGRVGFQITLTGDSEIGPAPRTHSENHIIDFNWASYRRVSGVKVFLVDAYSGESNRPGKDG